MADAEIKNPNKALTAFFVALTIAATIGIFSNLSNLSSPEGFTNAGIILILVYNIGFWGMVYRISRHFKFYLKGRPGARFFSIILTASFVICFFFIFAFTYSQLNNYSEPDIEEGSFLMQNEVPDLDP